MERNFIQNKIDRRGIQIINAREIKIGFKNLGTL